MPMEMKMFAITSGSLYEAQRKSKGLTATRGREGKEECSRRMPNDADDGQPRLPAGLEPELCKNMA